jgi:hypothetical protein
MQIVACVIGIHKWQWSRRPNSERVVECAHCGKLGHDLSVMKGYRSREKPSPSPSSGTDDRWREIRRE